MSGRASLSNVAVALVAALLLGWLALLGVERGLDVGVVTKDARVRNGAIADFDELWHLQTGRVICETRGVPDRDPFTFTSGDTKWTNTNWLAQAILWAVYRVGGIELDWVLGVALWLGAVALVHERARRRARSPWAVLPVSFYALTCLRRASEVRPQGWTFLLLAAALLVIELPLAARRRALALGALLALAGQMHGGFIFLHVAVLLAALAEAWEARSLRAAAPLGGALGLGLAGFLVHPHGLDALWHPFRYALDERIKLMGAWTSELAPPDLRGSSGPLIELPLAAVLLGACLGRSAPEAGQKRLSVGDALLVAAFAHLAFTSARGVHYFAIAVAGPLASALDALLDATRASKLLAPLDGAARAFARFAPLALAAALAITAAGRASRFTRGVPGDMTSRLLEGHADVADVASFLASQPAAARCFHAQEQGGALLWRLWPERRVFIDGRGDLHALTGAFAEQKTVLRLEPGWEKVLDRHGCDLALVGHDQETGRHDPLEDALAARGWKPVHANARFVVLARPSKNQ